MDFLKVVFVILIGLGASACQKTIKVQEGVKWTSDQVNDRPDPHSYSNPHQVAVVHMNLSLEVDFDRKRIDGTIDYDLDRKTMDPLVLDTRNLMVDAVVDQDGRSLPFGHELSKKDALGAPLYIQLHESTRSVSIDYYTTAESDALQWLAPEQTADKKYPFLFTQGQAILTRTWMPCQDSPGARSTYSAEVKVPKDLMAVMSASNPTEKSSTGVYKFKMNQAIPPYLIALAVGDLSYKKIGDRTGVYAEASVVDKAASEFEDMERMLLVAEDLYGPYLWDQYDVIVLPPSFPFGGMENPRLTFATPTILAGDKSLTALIAHELAHSWSGNLVTNATWDDFWLNEGFTVYFERRIMEALYGRDYADMLQILGYQDLEHDVHDLGHKHPDTHLKLSLSGRDPDEGMTDIAYEKGAFFLEMLEQAVGRERWDIFLKQYFETHRFQSMTTAKFESYLQEELINKYAIDVNTEEWIHGPGIPSSAPLASSTRFDNAAQAALDFADGKSPSSSLTATWTTHEWLHFLRSLDPKTDAAATAKLDRDLGFSQSGNSEILALWLEKSIRSSYMDNEAELRRFLTEVGRRKFLVPLYRALKETDRLDLAKDIYQEARKNYHAVSRSSLDAMLGV